MGLGSATCGGGFGDEDEFGGSRLDVCARGGLELSNTGGAGLDFEGRTLGAKVSTTLGDGVLEMGGSLGGSSTTGLGKAAAGGAGGGGVGVTG